MSDPSSVARDATDNPTSPLDEIDQALEALGVDTGGFERPSARAVHAASRRGGFGTPLPRNFRLLWAATGLSNLGDGLRLVAMPLLATSVTSDPRLIAGVTVAQQLPWLFFILPGGAWADRFDRRALRMRLDWARAAVMAVLVAAIAFDQVSIAVIYVVAALLASAEAVVDSSSMAMVPATVDGADLERAGGRLASTELGMNDLVGPPLGGLLFGLAIAVPFGVDAVTFAGAAIVMSFMTGSYRPSSSTVAGVRPSMRASLAEGIGWLWNHRLLRTLALVSTALGTGRSSAMRCSSSSPPTPSSCPISGTACCSYPARSAESQGR